MKSSEYRYKIESIHFDCTDDPHWLLSDSDFKLFDDMALHCKAGNLVLENWKIFLDGRGEKSPESYFEWWGVNRPDKIDMVHPEKKKSPFDEVKKVVRIE